MGGRFETSGCGEVICTIAGGVNEILRNILAIRFLNPTTGR